MFAQYAYDFSQTPAVNAQRSLRHCLSWMAEVLYDNGHVLESITLTQRGLSKAELNTLCVNVPEWVAYQRILEASDAATFNAYGRFVLTAMGRELMFDMFGQGAADCA
ncbi:hypothetical protein B0H98_106160 [Vreelandella songnenensis]|uniref:Uncharacterized protein n=1 Tax=Vreelandella songnenensis TaxID=1176243 RepID=A0A2T0V2F6_9GAMM|nr:hypothetical protein [Halomonas songnenensis]PRY64248.1 hypothetical protein B0H98_106160 [Halomonas songnenensis]